MKFSVITPSFNQSLYLKETIESVISQKGDFSIEYFVMDGGSKDGSLDILKQYARQLKKNPRITFYWQSKKDGGQSNAINLGIQKSTGDIISYINSDDYYLPNAFNKVTKYFESHPKIQWVVGNCKVSDPKLSWTFWLKHIWPIQLFKNALYIINTTNQPSVFIKKSLIRKVGFFDTSYNYAFDYDYWLRCLDFSLPGRIFSNLSGFRVHSSSKGSTGFKKQFQEDYHVYRKYNNVTLIKCLHSLANRFVSFIYKFLK